MYTKRRHIKGHFAHILESWCLLLFVIYLLTFQRKKASKKHLFLTFFDYLHTCPLLYFLKLNQWHLVNYLHSCLSLLHTIRVCAFVGVSVCWSVALCWRAVNGLPQKWSLMYNLSSLHWLRQPREQVKEGAEKPVCEERDWIDAASQCTSSPQGGQGGGQGRGIGGRGLLRGVDGWEERGAHTVLSSPVTTSVELCVNMRERIWWLLLMMPLSFFSWYLHATPCMSFHLDNKESHFIARKQWCTCWKCLDLDALKIKKYLLLWFYLISLVEIFSIWYFWFVNFFGSTELVCVCVCARLCMWQSQDTDC